MWTCSLLMCVVVVVTTRSPAALNSPASRNIEVVLPPPPTNETTAPRSTRSALANDIPSRLPMVHDYSTHGTTPKNSHVGRGFSRDTLLILYVKNTSSLPFYFVERVAAEETVSKLRIWWFELRAGPKARHRIGPT